MRCRLLMQLLQCDSQAVGAGRCHWMILRGYRKTSDKNQDQSAIPYLYLSQFLDSSGLPFFWRQEERFVALLHLTLEQNVSLASTPFACGRLAVRFLLVA